MAIYQSECMCENMQMRFEHYTVYNDSQICGPHLVPHRPRWSPYSTAAAPIKVNKTITKHSTLIKSLLLWLYRYPLVLNLNLFITHKEIFKRTGFSL